MISNNYYSELELSNFATEEEIRNQYKKLIKLNHPDKGGDHLNFIRLKSAYEFLTNKEIKLELDNKLIIEEEVIEKSEELLDYSIELDKSSTLSISFICWQCGMKNKQLLTEELSKILNDNKSYYKDTMEEEKENNNFPNLKMKIFRGTRILLECNFCSLKYKISRIKE